MKAPLAASILALIERFDTFSWTTMGFGMIRTYLDADKRWRLNVWDDRLRVAGVSTIHDHPWSFTSFVIAGQLINCPFEVNCWWRGGGSDEPPTHSWHRIKTGEGGGPVEAPQTAHLHALRTHVYDAGQQYTQRLTDVHETLFKRGTVTLNDRSPPTAEYTARVFWPIGQDWVDAIPRQATREEVLSAIRAALPLLKLAL